MIRFGPSGNDEKFYQEGHQSSVEAPQWLHALGLNAYEISFGLGIRMSEKTAQIIGQAAQKNDVQVSVHAPYYINLANPASLDKNYHYIKRSLILLKLLGGTHLVVHPGSQMQLARAVALQNCRDSLKTIVARLQADGFDDYYLCLETMGKYAQIGNLEEVCNLCAVDSHLIPTVDLGHLNCLAQGQLDLKTVFQTLAPFAQVHFHISFIQYGPKGELRHLTLNDTEYGFNLDTVMRFLKQRPQQDVVICECAGTMARDSLKLREIYLQQK